MKKHGVSARRKSNAIFHRQKKKLNMFTGETSAPTVSAIRGAANI